jgi:2-iminobutanoate/2-iminopropanoate deaminase
LSKQRIISPDVSEVGPGLWSNAIRAGDLLFIAGQVARPFDANGPGGKVIGTGEYEQTKQIFARIKHIVEAAGGTMDDIVKVTIYVVNIKQNKEVWRARKEFFTGDFPTSTLVEVRSLANAETLVEIESVAYLGGR